jgi:ubiquinone/menaquinone biosynthesis C-methylase UbiE
LRRETDHLEAIGVKGIEQIPWLYDLQCGLLERFGLGRWREWVVRGARGLSLDLGCGTGRNLPLYRGRAVGIDPSRQALARARRRAPKALLVRGSAEALPFRDGAFETVVSGLVLCSVPHPDRALAEARRVLEDDGELRLLEHVRSETPWKARMQDRITPLWSFVTGGCHPNRDTEAAVARAGFAVVERRAKNDMRRLAVRKVDAEGPIRLHR